MQREPIVAFLWQQELRERATVCRYLVLLIVDPVMVASCANGLTLSNSTFYSVSPHLWCIWISEQTAIISSYINWLVSINETGVCLLRGTN